MEHIYSKQLLQRRKKICHVFAVKPFLYLMFSLFCFVFGYIPFAPQMFTELCFGRHKLSVFIVSRATTEKTVGFLCLCEGPRPRVQSHVCIYPEVWRSLVEKSCGCCAPRQMCLSCHHTVMGPADGDDEESRGYEFSRQLQRSS